MLALAFCGQSVKLLNKEAYNIIKQKEVASYLASKTPFQASNIFACYDNNNSYVVYSYQTIILKVSAENDIYFDTKYYSRTTSKLQNKIRKAFHL